MDPAIFFDPDGFVLDGPRLMGRQMAGNGFLRAAVKAHAGRTITAYATDRQKAVVFRDLALPTDPDVQVRWIPAARLDQLGSLGVLHRADTNLAVHARERLRVGPAAYSITGVTHTLSSHGPADLLAELSTAPVMPWDALICTSTAALTFVQGRLDAQEDYLAWRFGQRVTPARPQLPVIPLGVHCGDFAFTADDRARGRAGLQIAEDEVVALFVGRLTFNAKAHPYQMLSALEAQAKRSGHKLVLIQAGQFPSPAIDQAFRAATASFAPSIRTLFVDGSDAVKFGQAWRSADIFVSLSDNYQETFGLTPIEAMAAGLPVLVSDWDGYKDTVREGIDGFRIPTWAPAGGLDIGAAMAADYETAMVNYDYFLSRTSTVVSLDMDVLAARLGELVSQPELRRRMGEAGRERARSVFDWSVVYRAHEALWAELAQIRGQAGAAPDYAQAPTAAPNRGDPFEAFAHYPTWTIAPATRVGLRPGASSERYAELTGQSLFAYWKIPPERVAQMLGALAGGPLTIADLAAAIGEWPSILIEQVARLAKMELVALEPPAGR